MMLRRIKLLVNILTLLVIICMFLLPFVKKTRRPKKYFNRYYYGDNEETIKRRREGRQYIDMTTTRVRPYELNPSNIKRNENITVEKIIFIEPYYGNNVLTPKQACAVESAARTHPERKILVFFRKTISKSKLYGPIKARRALQGYNNIKYKIVNISLIGQSTPFHNLGKLILNGSKHIDKHFVDLLRLILLYKYGGTYIDLDVIVARHLGVLGKNFVGFDDEYTIGSTIIATSVEGVGAYFTATSLRDFGANYRGDLYDFNGRDLLMRTLNKICTTSDTLDMSAETCYDLEVYKPKYFNPIPRQEKYRYFLTQKNDLVFPRYAYIYHTWENKKTTSSSNFDPRCEFLKLAKKHCPMVYKYCYKSVYRD